jgi:hypothetical protein
LGEHSAAEDVVQETFLQISAVADKVNTPDSPSHSGIGPTTGSILSVSQQSTEREDEPELLALGTKQVCELWKSLNGVLWYGSTESLTDMVSTF